MHNINSTAGAEWRVRVVLICTQNDALKETQGERRRRRPPSLSFLGGHFCVRCCYCHHRSRLLMHTYESTLKVETSAPPPSSVCIYVGGWARAFLKRAPAGARFKAESELAVPLTILVCVFRAGGGGRVDTRCLGPPHTFCSVQFPPPCVCTYTPHHFYSTPPSHHLNLSQRDTCCKHQKSASRPLYA